MKDFIEFCLSYPLWAKLTILALLLGVVAILFLVPRKNTGSADDLVIDDVINNGFELQFDFRLRNKGTSSMAISRVLFKIVDYSEGPSMIGKQTFSDKATLVFDKNTMTDSLLEAPIAVTLKPDELDRIGLDVKWNGERAYNGRYYIIVPVFKTSFGYKRCKALQFHIQQGFWGEGYGTSMQRTLMSLDQANAVPIIWPEF